MTNADFTKTSLDQKIAKLGLDKILQLKTLQIEQKDSLIFWVENYFDKMIFKGKVGYISLNPRSLIPCHYIHGI